MEDILLLAYSASMNPSPVISGGDENFAAKIAPAMVQACSSTSELLSYWDRLSLPVAYSCRCFFANCLMHASGSSNVLTAIPKVPQRIQAFPTPIGNFGLWILSEMLPPAYSPPPSPLAERAVSLIKSFTKVHSGLNEENENYISVLQSKELGPVVGKCDISGYIIILVTVFNIIIIFLLHF